MSVSNKIFDTNVQLVKYKVLKEVIKHAFAGDLASSQISIAKKIAAGNKGKHALLHLQGAGYFRRKSVDGNGWRQDQSQSHRGDRHRL